MLIEIHVYKTKYLTHEVLSSTYNDDCDYHLVEKKKAVDEDRHYQQAKKRMEKINKQLEEDEIVF